MRGNVRVTVVDESEAEVFCGTGVPSKGPVGTGVGVPAGGVGRCDVIVTADEKVTGKVIVKFDPEIEEPVIDGIDVDDEVFCANAGMSRRDPTNAVAVAVMKPIFEEPLRRR